METASIKQYVHRLETWAASAHLSSTLPSFTVIFKPFCLQCCWPAGPLRTLFSCPLLISPAFFWLFFPLAFLIPTHESFKMLKLGLQSWSMLNVQELQGSSCTVSTSWVFVCKGIGTVAGLKHLDRSQINSSVTHWSESKPLGCQGAAWAKTNTLNLSV